MLLYAITDRKAFPGSDQEQCAQLVAYAKAWATAGVDYIQIREKDLSAAALGALARETVRVVRGAGSHTRVLVNGPASLAAEAGADGVHLPFSAASAAGIAAARELFAGGNTIVSVACHSAAEVQQARDGGASLALFAPVFEKVLRSEEGRIGRLEGQGLPALAKACALGHPMPVFALGGVTRENAPACMEAGASGIAAIRYFLESW